MGSHRCKCANAPNGQCIGPSCLWYGDNLVKSLMSAEDADARASASKVRGHESRLRGAAHAPSDFDVARGRDGEYIVTGRDGSKRVVKA